MFRCWQRGLCSSSSTRDPSHVWAALMEMYLRKGTEEHQKRGTNRGHERTRSGKEEEEEEKGRCSALEQSLPKGAAHGGPTPQPRKQTQRAAEKLIHPDSNPLSHILPVLVTRWGRAVCGVKLRMGKEEGWIPPSASMFVFFLLPSN